MRRYEIISCDGHLETPCEGWLKLIPQRYRAFAPRLVDCPDGGQGWLVENMPIIHNGTNIAGGGAVRLKGASYWTPDGKAAPGTGGPEQRLREQDQDGIDAEILYPPAFVSRFIEKVSDRNAYLAMIRAYNWYVSSEYCSIAPDRLIACGLIPVGGLNDAIIELEYIHNLGLKAICLSQFPNGAATPQRDDDEFWQRALDLNMPVTAHVSVGDPTHPMLVRAAAGDLDVATAMMRGTTPAPVSFMSQIIASGVFDRFQDLRIYIAESNAGWLPEVMYMMDDSYLMFREALGAQLKRLPSEYIRDNFYFGIVRDPIAIRCADLLPATHLMWGSDFPHAVTSFPNSRDHLNEIFAQAPRALRRRILLENPCEFFCLDRFASLTPTPNRC